MYCYKENWIDWLIEVCFWCWIDFFTIHSDTALYVIAGVWYRRSNSCEELGISTMENYEDNTVHSLHFGNHSLKDEVSCFTSVSPKWSQESWVHVAKTSLDKLDFFVFISYESSWNCICYIIGSFLMQWCSRGNLHGGAKCESIIVHCEMIEEWWYQFFKAAGSR